MIDLTKYFDKIYCINLDSSTDRWIETVKEFEKWGITGVERYSAVNGDTLNIESEILIPGEIGITMTHINIINECKKRGYKNVLIMEDDVYFTEDILKFNEYMESLPNDWSLFYLGGMQLGGKPPIPINKNILKVNHVLMLHCFAINSNIFDLILELIPNLEKQVDHYYIDIQKIFPTYLTNPYIAYQRVGFSDIQKKEVNYDKYYKLNYE